MKIEYSKPKPFIMTDLDEKIQKLITSKEEINKNLALELLQSQNNLSEEDARKLVYYNAIDLIEGKTFIKVEKCEYEGGDALKFYETEKSGVVMYHSQDCCESVYINDINGDLSDLVGVEILKCEERISQEDDDEWGGSTTWTFYTIATRKGFVDIRWNGSSNGYYSERVDISTFGD